MRQFLLSVMAFIALPFVANAVISEDDTPPVMNEADGSILDPNEGHVFDSIKNDDETAMFVRDYI